MTKRVPIIAADWAAPTTVCAMTTTRAGGLSAAPYDSLNLGLHVKDDDSAVRRNRALIASELEFPSAPHWLNQTHSTHVFDGRSKAQDRSQQGSKAQDSNAQDSNAQDSNLQSNQQDSHDAAWTNRQGQVIGVLTADCLPVVICTLDSAEVGVAHAGWRGLADGVLVNLVERFESPVAKLQAWLGPAIGPEQFEVGEDVLRYYLSSWTEMEPSEIQAAFVACAPGKWYADLYALARLQLAGLGLNLISGGEHCTFTQKDLFFSYRRDGHRSGRMLTAAWLPVPVAPQ